MIRVLVVDDEELVRSGVSAILGGADDIEVVGAAADGETALLLGRELAPDVVLLDLSMPGLPGLEVATRFRAELPGRAVVILTTFDRDGYVARALALGLQGFVLKASSPAELTAAVRVAAVGGTYVSPRITARLVAAAPEEPSGPSFEDLSARELEVLELLATGESNQGIARHLFLSEGTVKVHVKAILRKLGLANRVQAAVAAHRVGLGGIRSSRTPPR